MTHIAAIGALAQVSALGLGGALICAADTSDQIRHAWATLPATVGIVVLTDPAAQALTAERAAPGAPMTVVMAPWPA